MVFSSFTFLFIFLPVTWLFYFLAPDRFRNGILLLASIVFYAWGEPVYVFLMAASMVFNYLSGKLIASSTGKRAGILLAEAVLMNLSILFFFKYFGFFVQNINHLPGIHLTVRKLPLPLGISFYTFQAVSYLIDVYRGETNVQDKFLDFALYIAMFPQLVAGPIVRYVDIEKQLAKRTFSMSGFGNGVRIFIIGLAKKVILANRMGELHEIVKAGFRSGSTGSVLYFWLGAAAYTFQIYFDFSGYSDMAIGLGKMFGFKFKINFDHPYTSASITEFWRRWHISLGTWFREYVYIPLGGNRKGTGRQILNLMVVWFLTGLWHGAQWNFVVWGMYYGILLIIEKFVWQKWLDRLPSVLRKIYVLFAVNIGWVFFSSDGLKEAVRYLSVMFHRTAGGWIGHEAVFLLVNHALLWITAALCCTGLVKNVIVHQGFQKKRKLVTDVGFMILFLVTLAYLVAGTYNPFIYFRF